MASAFEELASILDEISGLQIRTTNLDVPKKSPSITLAPSSTTHIPRGLKVDRVNKVYTGELLMLTLRGRLKPDVVTFESLKQDIRDKIYDNRTLNNQVCDCKIEGSTTIINKGEAKIKLICHFRFRTTELLV